MNYTPNNTFGDIPLTGVLIPGITEGYIAESKYIKSGYIVVKTIEERDKLLDKTLYEDKEITIGTPVFVSDENKTYRYMGEDTGPNIWLEDTADLQDINANISNIQQILLNQKTEIDSKLNIDTFNSTIENINNELSVHTEQLNNKVDNAIFENTLQNLNASLENKANKDEIPTSLAQLSNLETGYITADVNNLSNYYTKSEIDAQSNENLIWDFDTKYATYTVGGIPAGYGLSGKTLKQILYQMLVRAEAPFITEPTLEVTINNAIGIANTYITVNGTITFNRGTIINSVNGSLEGYRAGEVTSYMVGTEEIETTSSSEQTITYNFDNLNVGPLPLGNSQTPVRVYYSEGDQPKLSDGVTDYGEALPAGYLESYFTVTGLTNTWTGTSPENVTEVDNIHFYETNGAITDNTSDPYIIQNNRVIDIEGMFQDLEDGTVTGTGFQVATPEITGPDQVQTVLIQSSVDVTGIKVWDEFTNSWHWVTTDPGEDIPTKEDSLKAFKKSDIMYTKTINHQEISYYAYTYVGSGTGKLYFRFYIN